MKISVVDFDNKQMEEIVLSPEVFGKDVRADILHRVVEWQRAKRRSGNHSTKTISDISGTTKKMYKQKGMGKARHGSNRAGQFRGGATSLGPVVRSHEYSIQKKVKELALKMALSSKYKEKKLVVLKDLSVEEYKTKSLLVKLNKLGVSSGLFIGVNDEKDVNFIRAYRNIKHIDALPAEGVNVLDILNHEHLLITKECVEKLKTRLS